MTDKTEFGIDEIEFRAWLSHPMTKKFSKLIFKQAEEFVVNSGTLAFKTHTKGNFDNTNQIKSLLNKAEGLVYSSNLINDCLEQLNTEREALIDKGEISKEDLKNYPIYQLLSLVNNDKE